MYAIESALHETLAMGIRPEVVVLNDQNVPLGTVQIIIRAGAGMHTQAEREAWALDQAEQVRKLLNPTETPGRARTESP